MKLLIYAVVLTAYRLKTLLLFPVLFGIEGGWISAHWHWPLGTLPQLPRHTIMWACSLSRTAQFSIISVAGPSPGIRYSKGRAGYKVRALHDGIEFW